ncbi:hypothetical protein [Carnobacterium maltaromaticum]|uniref:hypothetical protein n=1 Tax=Carnobacterium maltaromaticum TaxID=2751 RepID=UPI00295E72CE|nr:hypothetical protein [Carnobacterium maltaromaticum]
MKQNKKSLRIIFAIAFIYSFIYGYQFFLTGGISAETPKSNLLNERSLENRISTELEDGWVEGSSADFIQNNSHKISWNQGVWRYDHASIPWVENEQIEATLLINGSFLSGTSEDVGNGFLKAGLTESIYTKNVAQNTLKRSFPYKTYFIDIIQQLLEDGSVEVSYQVRNAGLAAQKIGISQYVDLAPDGPISITNGYKGLNVTTATGVIALMPDPITMPNWAIGKDSTAKDFYPYSTKTATGLGWETGKRYRENGTLLSPPLLLQENKPVELANSEATMKNPGVVVQPNEATIFKQTVKSGGMIPPEITVDQKNESIYQNEKLTVTGTISDIDNQNYRLYLEMDDVGKTLIPLKEFTDIPFQETQAYEVKIDGDLFRLGSHTVSIIGIDEYGASSTPERITFVKHEISELPLAQKVKATDVGWLAGAASDSISSSGYKIEWHRYYGSQTGMWWYTYLGQKWMYQNTIAALLLINGSYVGGTTDLPERGQGFLDSDLDQSVFTKNPAMKALKRTFVYLDSYKIDIIQQLQENNAVEVTYRVTNLKAETQNIGISQAVDVFVGSDSVPVIPINGFKGINLTYGDSSLAMLPDPLSFPNWAAATRFDIDNFKPYSNGRFNGTGWEKGMRNGNKSLTENTSVYLGDSAIAMKNPGVNVGNNQSYSFKQLIKFGGFEAPVVTLNQSSISLYADQKVNISGTVLDKDNQNYRLYLEMNDANKSLILLADYQNIPLGKVQSYQSEIKGEWFSSSYNRVSIIAIDEYGTRSTAQNLAVTLTELGGTAAIQKVKVGEALSTDINVLFSTIKGANTSLKEVEVIDTSIVGFQWARVTLTDGKERTTLVYIPVNVYNPASTVFNDVDRIALDARDVVFALADIPQNSEVGKLDEMVLKAVAPKAWNISNGAMIPTAMLKNEIKPLIGKYQATFKATRADTGKSLQRDSQLTVEGILEFREVPSALDFEKAKVNQKEPYIARKILDWNLKINNSKGANWSLSASVTPFSTIKNENLENLLVYKELGKPDKIINGTSQVVVEGNNLNTNPIVQWNANTGLFLKPIPGVKIGTYRGQIDWTLTEAP